MVSHAGVSGEAAVYRQHSAGDKAGCFIADKVEQGAQKLFGLTEAVHGGTGKTTTASFFVRAAKELGLAKEILVIDADPDANLATTLNVQFNGTIAEAVDKRKKTMDEGVVGEKLRADMYDVICHGEYFDFIVMGRRKGSGCYCSINSALDNIIAETMNMYDLVVIDFDAGLEHFSRGTGSNNDTLLIACDQSIPKRDSITAWSACGTTASTTWS